MKQSFSLNFTSFPNKGDTQECYTLKAKAREAGISISECVHQSVLGSVIKQWLTTETQYLIGRHHDKEHPHVHIVFNRVDYNGRTISDRNDHFRSEKICKDLTQKYKLYFAHGKENVKEHRLREPDKTKYEIYNSLKKLIFLVSFLISLTFSITFINIF